MVKGGGSVLLIFNSHAYKGKRYVEKKPTTVMQDALEWVEEIQTGIAEEDEEEEIARLTEYMDSVKHAAVKFGVKIPGELENAAGKKDQPRDSLVGQDMDYGGFIGPHGSESLRRYALNGTYGLCKYAKQNQAKFEAYEEVEKRLLAFYRDMMRERHAALNESGVYSRTTALEEEDIKVVKNDNDGDDDDDDCKWDAGDSDDIDAWDGDDHQVEKEPYVKVEITNYIESIRHGSGDDGIAASTVEPELIGIIREGDKRKPVPVQEPEPEPAPPGVDQDTYAKISPTAEREGSGWGVMGGWDLKQLEGAAVEPDESDAVEVDETKVNCHLLTR